MTQDIIDRKVWRANPRQELFLAIPPTIKEAFYGGGAGSGKSDVLLVYGIVHRWHENPRFKQVFMRRTYPELKNEIVPRSRELFLKFGATFNKTDMAWTFPRTDQLGGTGMGNQGAMIFLASCEHEDDVHKFDSMEISLYTPDELTSLTEYIYLYVAFERNRAPKGSGLPSITRAAGMPGGKGHTFVKKRFVDPHPAGSKIIIGKGGNKRIYIHATLADNPHIDPTYSQSLDGRPEAERKAKKFGDWSAYLGQVFDEFRDKKYPDEPPNALHCIPPFEIPSWWPRIVVIDWGFAAMNYVTYSAISPTRRVITYREQVWLKTKIEEWAPYAKVLIDKENPRKVILCRSAKQDRGTDHTVQEQIESALGRSVDLSDNSAGSRVATKLLMHEYLRWKPKPVIPVEDMPIYSEEYAMWLLRNKGLIDYKSYLAQFDPPEEETNIPKWIIFKCEDHDHEGHEFCCPTLVESIKACSYDKPKDGKAAEDVAEFEGDDPYDNARYLLDAADKYFDESAEEFKKIQRMEELSAKLAATQDFTAFYRNARTIDAATGGLQVVSRYHHRPRR